MSQIQKPMMWTSKGNLPTDELSDREVHWTIHEEYIKLEYIYRLKATGEVVVHGADVLSLRGVTGETMIGVVS